MVNAFNAVYNTQLNCANQGLNIANDIAGTQHVGGPAHQDAATGQFYVLDNVGKRVGAGLDTDDAGIVERPGVST